MFLFWELLHSKIHSLAILNRKLWCVFILWAISPSPGVAEAILVFWIYLAVFEFYLCFFYSTVNDILCCICLYIMKLCGMCLGFSVQMTITSMSIMLSMPMPSLIGWIWCWSPCLVGNVAGKRYTIHCCYKCESLLTDSVEEGRMIPLYTFVLPLPQWGMPQLKKASHCSQLSSFWCCFHLL